MAVSSSSPSDPLTRDPARSIAMVITWARVAPRPLRHPRRRRAELPRGAPGRGVLVLAARAAAPDQPRLDPQPAARAGRVRLPHAQRERPPLLARPRARRAR